MRLSRIVRLLAVLTVLTATVGVQSALAKTDGQQTPARYERLLREAQDRGSVRVVVAIQDMAVQRSVMAGAVAAGAQVIKRYNHLPYLLLQVGPSAVRDLIADPRVVTFQEDGLSAPTLNNSVPHINGDIVHQAGYTGTGFAVADLDTGIDEDHPFFAGRIVDEACYSNAGGSGSGVSLCPGGGTSQTGLGSADGETGQCFRTANDTTTANLCSHGTHTAGIMAGSESSDPSNAPGDGVAPGGNLLPIQVFTRFNDDTSCGGPGEAPCVRTYASDQISALNRVAALAGTHNIVAANMSLGDTANNTSNCDADSRKVAIDSLIALNVATVISAGNEGHPDGVGAPGCISTAITVGATNNSDNIAGFSNQGHLLDLFAPGVSVKSSVPDDTYDFMSGTSMAAPHVTGTWAVLRQAHPSETVAQILTRLQTCGVNIHYTNSAGTFDTERIDLLGALSCGDPSTTDLSSSANPSVFGQPVTLTAHVFDALDPALPGTGTVTFKESGVPFDTENLDRTGTASTVLTGLSVGTHSFTADYTPGFLGSSSSAPLVQVVNKDTTTTALSSSANPSTFGEPVTFTAQVTADPPGSGTPTGTVTFFDNGTLLGSAPLDPAAQASLTTAGLQVGSHTIQADYSGDPNFFGSTASLLQSVICTTTITGSHGQLTVSSGATCVNLATIHGSITVQPGAALWIADSTVNGGVDSGGATALTICGSKVTGGVTADGTTGFVLLGDGGDDGSPGCAGNEVRQGIRLTNNLGQAEVGGNLVRGWVRLMNTSGVGPTPENAASEIEANTIKGGGLACLGNVPPPTNDGLPNSVTGSETGQCVGF
jgi:subtilisin family serine protease